MKKVLALVLALCMVFALYACGQKAEPAPAAAPAEAPAAAPAEAPAEAVEEVAAEPEITGTVVCFSPSTDIDNESIKVGFEAKYPNAEVEFINGSTGEGIARLQAEGDNPSIDVFYSGLNQGDGDMYTDLFEHYVSPYNADLPEQYQSNNGFYNYDHIASVAFCVNIDLEKELGFEITSYEDLLRPELNGRFLCSDPNASSAAWNNVCNIFSAYGADSEEGWNMLEGLLANGMVIAGSSSACYKSVQQGEYVVGLTNEDGAAPLIRDGADNIKIVYPDEGTSAFAFACAVVKNAPHMDAAKALVDYITSLEGQNFRANYVQTTRFTNANVVAEESVLVPTDTIKWASRDLQWLIDNKEAILAKYNELYNKYN